MECGHPTMMRSSDGRVYNKMVEQIERMGRTRGEDWRHYRKLLLSNAGEEQNYFAGRTTSVMKKAELERCQTCYSECSEAAWSAMKSCWTLLCRGSKKHKHDYWKGEWMREDRRQRCLKKNEERTVTAGRNTRCGEREGQRGHQRGGQRGHQALVARRSLLHVVTASLPRVTTC